MAKHAQCWKLIHDITGRISAKKGIIKGDNSEVRINKWFNHFRNVLGGSNIDETDIFEPETIFEGTLDTDTAVFTQ